jgi:hypothetical protein
MATIHQHPSNPIAILDAFAERGPDALRAYAKQAVAAYRAATFDDTAEDERRLAGIDLTERLIAEFGAKTVAGWVRLHAALRGESV